MEAQRRAVRERLVEIVVRQRQNLVVANSHNDAWVECLLDAANTLGKTDKSIEEIPKASFIACRDRDDAMRSHLASFLGPTSIVEERKAKALPILVRYVQALRSSGHRPSRPEMDI
jgi:hypothetical protein